MAYHTLSRLVRPSPSPSSPADHPLSHPRRSSSFVHSPRRSPHSSQVSSPTIHQEGYFDDAPSAGAGPSRQRAHAATISNTRRRIGSAVDELDSEEAQRYRTRISANSARSSPSLLRTPTFADLEDLSLTLRPQRSRDTRKGWAGFLDGLSKEERGVLGTRYDLMSDGELDEHLKQLDPSHLLSPGGLATPQETSSPLTPKASGDRFERLRKVDEDKTPLFPPSPPSSRVYSGGGNADQADHPLRVLSRVIGELREVVERLEEENERLRIEQVERRVSSKRIAKTADEVSLHDSINEALSTSLTSISPLKDHPPLPLSIAESSRSLRSISPTPSTSRSIRPRSPSVTSVAYPLSPPIRSTPSPSLRSTRSAEPSVPEPHNPTVRYLGRASWTSGLWVWSGNKNARSRKGSTESSASRTALKRTNAVGDGVTEEVIVDDDDDEAWRKGDGGSSPAFRAIFLATRILTPDPLSILSSSAILANSLLAYLAHSLVSTARDEGILAVDPVVQRRTRERARSRAASNASQDRPAPSNDTPTKEGKGYGDQAMTATANLGRSLLSSVSGATSRTRSHVSNEDSRPSLLSKASVNRPSLTTAVSPSIVSKAFVPTPNSPIEPSEERPLPSVELASMVADENRPPTVLLSRQNLGSFFQSPRSGKAGLKTASRFTSTDPPLTDRYGFIYDIQHASMLKDASAAGTAAPASLNGNSLAVDEEGWIDRQLKDRVARPASVTRHSTDTVSHSSPPSTDSSNSRDRPQHSGSTTPLSPKSVSEDKNRQRASTLLNRVPSPAGPVTSKDNLTVSSHGATSLHITSNPLPASTSLTHYPYAPNPASHPSRLTVSSLLDRLTEIHDQQQKERMVEWDAFLRRRAKSRGKSVLALQGRDGSVGIEDMRWGPGLIGISQMGLAGKRGEEEWKWFVKLVRGGIPLVYRSDVWAECSGAKDMMIPGEYKEILSVHKNDQSPVLGEIEKDVGRTFPGNVFFGGDGPGVTKLRRVLIAYSWHNPGVGYCQGMNMLAATLLLTHTDEEQAYWTLVCMIDRLLPPSFFSPDLLASRADQVVLGDLVRKHAPKVDDMLEELGIDLASLTFGWFLSLFTDCLPVETLFRVWDVFFVEGHNTLFRVAIAILKLNEPDILACQSVSDLLGLLGGTTSRLWAADKLIALQHSFKIVITRQEVQGRCERAIKQLEEEAGEE